LDKPRNVKNKSLRRSNDNGILKPDNRNLKRKTQRAVRVDIR
jgi:hypothetical protein